MVGILRKDLKALQPASELTGTGEPSRCCETDIGPLLDKTCLKPLATDCVTSVAKKKTTGVVPISRRDMRSIYAVKNTKEGVKWLVERDGKHGDGRIFSRQLIINETAEILLFSRAMRRIQAI